MSQHHLHWPTPISAGHPAGPLCQTFDVLFAWACMAPFAACLPFFLNPPFWYCALSSLPAAELPPATPVPVPVPTAPPTKTRGTVVPLSLVPAGRAR